MSAGRRVRRLAREAIPAVFRLAAGYAEPRLPESYRDWRREAASKMNVAELESFAQWVEKRGGTVAERFHCPACRREIATDAKAYADKLRADSSRYARYEQIRFKREDLDRMAKEALKYLEGMTNATEQAHTEQAHTEQAHTEQGGEKDTDTRDPHEEG